MEIVQNENRIYGETHTTIIMEMCKAPTLHLKALNTPTLHLKALNKHSITHNVHRDRYVISNKNVYLKKEEANT